MCATSQHQHLNRQSRHRLGVVPGHPSPDVVTGFGNEFVIPFDILCRESLRFEQATTSGNLSSSMGRTVPCWNSLQSRGKMHVSVISDLLNGLLIGQAKPLLDEQLSKRQHHWLRRGASRGVELRGICFFQRFPWHQRREEHPGVVRVQRAAKGTWNASIESRRLWCIRYNCGVKRLQ